MKEEKATNALREKEESSDPAGMKDAVSPGTEDPERDEATATATGNREGLRKAVDRKSKSLSEFSSKSIDNKQEKGND